VVLHPRRGLLILEAKDWRLETSQSADRASVSILTNTGRKAESNPLEQARQYAHVGAAALDRDPHLVVHEEGRHKNRLCFPWGYGVVLANITRRKFAETDLGEVMPPHRVICQDELVSSVDP